MRETTRDLDIPSNEVSNEKDTNETVDVESLKTKSDLNKKAYDESLFKALCRTFISRIWVAGVLKLVSGMTGSSFQIPRRNYRLTPTILDRYIENDNAAPQ